MEHSEIKESVTIRNGVNRTQLVVVFLLVFTTFLVCCNQCDQLKENQICKNEYYSDSTLFSKSCYYRNNSSVEKISFYEDGSIKEKFFISDSIGIMYRFYNENINSIGTCTLTWKDSIPYGIPNGAWTWYDENGKVRAIGFKREGKIDGWVTNFSINREIESINFYDNGLKEGKWIYFNENGEVSKTILYKNDVEIK